MTRILKDWALTILSASLLVTFILGGQTEEGLLWKGYSFVLLLGNMAAPSFVVVVRFVLFARQIDLKAIWLSEPLAASASLVTGRAVFTDNEVSYKTFFYDDALQQWDLHKATVFQRSSDADGL